MTDYVPPPPPPPSPWAAGPGAAPPAGYPANNPWATPAPAWPATPFGAPPAKRRSRWKLVVAAVVLLVAAGCGTLLFQAGSAMKKATDSANSYGRALVDSRYDDAYGQLCEADHAIYSIETFTEAHRDYSAYKIESLNLNNHNGVTGGELRLRMRVAAGGPDEIIVMAMRSEGGTWKPCRALLMLGK